MVLDTSRSLFKINLKIPLIPLIFCVNYFRSSLYCLWQFSRSLSGNISIYLRKRRSSILTDNHDVIQSILLYTHSLTSFTRSHILLENITFIITSIIQKCIMNPEWCLIIPLDTIRKMPTDKFLAISINTVEVCSTLFRVRSCRPNERGKRTTSFVCTFQVEKIVFCNIDVSSV